MSNNKGNSADPITNGHSNGHDEAPPPTNRRNGEVLGETARRLLAQQELRAELDGTE
jgi:hypothetical protein